MDTEKNIELQYWNEVLFIINRFLYSYQGIFKYQNMSKIFKNYMLCIQSLNNLH